MNAKPARRIREAPGFYDAAGSLSSKREWQELTRRIVCAAHPDMIILFGSRAYGAPRADSDLDLLLVMDSRGAPIDPTRQIRALFPDLPLTFDIRTQTPSQLTRRLAMGDAFMQEIVGRGKELYVKRAAHDIKAQVNAALQQGRIQPMENGEVVQEWVAKAEGNFKTVLALARLKKNLNPDDLCWACEQCVEKYLKAFLTRHRIKFERDHNLERFYTQCLTIDNDFRLIRVSLDSVTICTPKARYPGSGVTEAEARAAVVATKPIRKFVRAKLGLGK